MSGLVFTIVFWLAFGVAVVCCLACVLFLLILFEDYWRRRPQREPEPAPPRFEEEQFARAQARYEAHRDAEAERMELIREQLDEVWEDDEDPLSERAADEAIRELEERRRMCSEYERWLNTIPIANPWDVAA